MIADYGCRVCLGLLLVAAFSGAPALALIHGTWPDATVKALERDAQRGDASAALELHTYYKIYRHQRDEAARWLLHAAELGAPAALVMMGSKIHDFGGTFKNEGGPEVVRKLWERACATLASACRRLAGGLASGYFGAVDLPAARRYLTKGALLGDPVSAHELADRLREGSGGPRDPERAHYWYALLTRRVRPDTYLGWKVWTERVKLASELSLSQLQSIWRDLDVKFAAMDTGAGELALQRNPIAAEGLSLIKAREHRHRALITKGDRDFVEAYSPGGTVIQPYAPSGVSSLTIAMLSIGTFAIVIVAWWWLRRRRQIG